MKPILLPAMLLTLLAAHPALAATATEVPPRTDVMTTTYSFDLGAVDEAAPASVTAKLGGWNSNGPSATTEPQMVVGFSVNATFVTTVDLLFVSGLSESLNADITGLLVDGLNDFTFDIRDDFTGGNPATFQVGDVVVTYASDAGLAPVPLPASLPMLALAAGGLAALRRARA